MHKLREVGAKPLAVGRLDAHGRSVSVYTSVFGISLRDPDVIETPRPQGDPLGACADITRMRQVLGWAAQVGIEDEVSRYLEWLERTPEALPAWLRTEVRTAGW